MTGVAEHTILKLLEDMGCACAESHNRVVRNVRVKRVQCDKIWAFCYAKDKNVPREKRGQFGYGDVWTWTTTTPNSALLYETLHGLVGKEKVNCGSRFSCLCFKFQNAGDSHGRHTICNTIPNTLQEQTLHKQRRILLHTRYLSALQGGLPSALARHSAELPGELKPPPEVSPLPRFV
jgi:hypothetical protein